MTFLSMHFPFRKVQFHQSALMYVALATMELFGLFLKTRISNVFKYPRLRETFCVIPFSALDILVL